MKAPSRPRGVSALALFFLFGTTMAGLAAVSLAMPEGMLEPMWRINPRGQAGLGMLGPAGIILLAAVSLACLAAAAGLWTGRQWGRQLATIILGVNAVGDLLNGTIGHDPRALVGLPIAGALVYYLRTARVRTFFTSGPG